LKKGAFTSVTENSLFRRELLELFFCNDISSDVLRRVRGNLITRIKREFEDAYFLDDNDYEKFLEDVRNFVVRRISIRGTNNDNLSQTVLEYYVIKMSMWSPLIQKYFEQQTTYFQEAAVLLFIAYMMTKSEELGDLKYKDKIVTGKNPDQVKQVFLYSCFYTFMFNLDILY
jgi:hypothetical protein